MTSDDKSGSVPSPYVGEPTFSPPGVCGYSARPSSPQCDKPATFHIRVVDGEYGHVTLATCDEHRPIAHYAGHFEAEHPYTELCDVPGTGWQDAENVCVVMDDVEEPTKEV